MTWGSGVPALSSFRIYDKAAVTVIMWCWPNSRQKSDRTEQTAQKQTLHKWHCQPLGKAQITQ